MGWLTTGDIEARIKWMVLLDLADDDGNGQPDADVYDAVMADAEGEVESHLAGRYVVPLTSADKVVREIGSAIAIQKLYLRKNADSPQHVKDAFTAAMETLRKLAEGTAHLSIGTARRPGAQATLAPEDRVFTRETLGGY